MKKILIYTGVLVLFVIGLYGCGKSDMEETQSESQTLLSEVSEAETKQETEVITETESMVSPELPENFVEATTEQLQSLPNRDGLITAMSEILESIGVKDIQTVVYGNYREEKDVLRLINLDTYIITDTKKNLIMKSMYLETSSNAEWSVTSVTNADSELYYYVPDDLKNKFDIYDYATGKLISEKSEEMGDPVEEFNEKSEKLESEYHERLDDLKEKYTGHTEQQSETESNQEVSSNSKVSEMQYNGEYITDVAARDMEEYDYITDITILVDESKREINIAVQVPTGTDEDTVKMAGEDVARYLASMASWLNSDYKAPGSTDIGGIYDKYDLKLYLDDGFGNIDIWGAKVTYSNRITWN